MNEATEIRHIEDRATHIVRDQQQMMRRLISLRKHHGLTQEVVADRMGVSQPTVAGLERYDSNPTLSTIMRYAVAVEARLTTEVTDDSMQAWEPDAIGTVTQKVQAQVKSSWASAGDRDVRTSWSTQKMASAGVVR